MEIRPSEGKISSPEINSALLEIYQRLSRKMGWKFEVLDETLVHDDWRKDAVIRVSGAQAHKLLQFEAGIHRYIRKGQRDASIANRDKTHTVFSEISVYPEKVQSSFHFDFSKLSIQTYRAAAGPGGQHVNTTDTAVRVTHEPTGISAAVSKERSQHANKVTAIEIVRAKLQKRHEQEVRAAQSKLRRDGSSTLVADTYVRTYDERYDSFALASLLEGNIDAILQTRLIDKIFQDLSKMD